MSAFFSCRYLIKVGDHNLSKNEKAEQHMYLEKIYVHPNFNRSRFLNDIALVKLRVVVHLGKFIRTVCLPEKREGDLVVPLKYGIVAGWGTTKALKTGEGPKRAEQYANILQYSVFPVQHEQLCANKSAILPYNSTVTFCAGDGQGVKDACTGDGGGAFVRQAKRRDGYRWIAAGLVSWGNGCAQKNQYGYYTRVYPFIDWIKKTMDKG